MRGPTGVQPLSTHINRLPKEMIEMSMGGLSFDDLVAQIKQQQQQQERDAPPIDREQR